MCIDLLLNIFDLEVEIDCSVLDPLETLVEIFECLLHVGELLTSFVAFHEIQISCICMLLIGLLHLFVNNLQAIFELINASLYVKCFLEDLLTRGCSFVHLRVVQHFSEELVLVNFILACFTLAKVLG